MKRSFNLMLCVLITLGSCVQAEDVDIDPDVKPPGGFQVTLYRDRAFVSREVLVPPGESLRNLVVSDLPSSIVSDSVYAEGDSGTVVRSVRVSRRSTAKLSGDQLQQLDQQAADLDKERAEVQHKVEMVSQDIKALEQMVNFAAVAGKSDLDRGVLNADTLTQLITFSMSQQRELADERFQYETQLQELEQEIRELHARRSQATVRPEREAYEARISVETKENVAGTIRLNYLVNDCGWSPQYTVHGHSEQGSVQIRYSALVHQGSGEDWSNIGLVLSTASPSTSAARPLLTALEVSTVEPSSGDDDPFSTQPSQVIPTAGQGESLADMLQSLRAEQRQAESLFGDGQAEVSSERRDVALNSVAGQLQQIELQAEAQSWRNLAPDVRNDVASQIYNLPQPVSLESKSGRQVLQILDFELSGEMYHVATPLLSTFAYREAQVTNTQAVALLGGPAAIYLDDRFVGRVQLPSTASGQHVTIGFGADVQVRTRRELTDKQEVIKGGNRQLVFAYRLVVANFKDQSVAVRLMDRMPHTRQTQQLSVRLDTPPTAISDDPLYRRVQQPTGILRWDLTVPAGHHGSKAFDVDYSYTMEFDRSRVPTTEHCLDQLQAQYDNMLMPSGMGGMGGMGGSMGGGQ